MEKKESVTRVKDIKTMEGKTGNKYFLIETEMGKLSSFDKDIVAELQKFIGKSVKITYAVTSQGFMNLKSFIADEPVKEEKIEEKKEDKQSRMASISASYVKDLVVAGKSVDEAIEIVKKAFAAFNT